MQSIRWVPSAFLMAALAAMPACNLSPSAQRQDDVSPAAQQARDPGCRPVQTRPPNAPEQRPSFPGQTRACAEPTNVAFQLITLTENLEHPWAVEPLPDGRLLVTERPGRMRIVSADGALGEPLEGLPRVDARDQGGLLDVALSPSFEKDRTIFWSFSEPREGGNGTSVARGVLSSDERRLEQVRVIFRAMPTYDGTMHFGSRLVFDEDGLLFVTLGERFDRETRRQAQQLDSHLGKIVRIRADGSVPPDNPFVDRPGALPEIWTLGHRNIQSAALDARGRLWIVEHGAQGGDELNLIEKGKNYGWPLVAFGEEYSGRPFPNAVTAHPSYESPEYYWDPVIAPSGADFYGGDAFPAWRGSLFVGGLSSERLVRLSIDNDRVTGEEHLLTDRGRRVRDVREGRDGALYIVTDESNGALWKLVPQP